MKRARALLLLLPPLLSLRLATAASLAIVDPVVAQFDGGPSVASGAGFGSGESIFLSFSIAGYKPEGDEDELKLHVSWTCEAVDAAGVPLLKPLSGVVKVDLAPEDKKWLPKGRVELPMPQGLLEGRGEIRISARDHIANTSAELTVPFRMRGPKLDAGAGLQASRFRFLRSDDDMEPLRVAAYRPGDTVWAKFDIAGYTIGPENAFDISYGLEVFRANGESLFQQPEAAQEAGKSFYPERFKLGALSLSLNKDLAVGEYTIVLKLRDKLGAKEAESKHIFQVE